jgi:hypothetical protein
MEASDPMNGSAIVWTGTLGACCVIFLACWQPWKPRPRHTARAVERTLAKAAGPGRVRLPRAGSMQYADELAYWKSGGDWDPDWAGPEDWPGPGPTGDPLTDWANDPDTTWVERLKAEIDALPGPLTVAGFIPAPPPAALESGPVQGPAGAQPCEVCGSLPVPIYDQARTLIKYGPACGCGERLADTGELSAVARRATYAAELEDQEVSHAAFLDELLDAWTRLRAASFRITIERTLGR